MSKNRAKLWILFGLWLVALGAGWCQRWKQEQQLSVPRLVMCDVGQGDAFLIIDGKTQVLIDGGPDAAVLKCLNEEMPAGDQEIELVVLTHADLDHFGGLAAVWQTYQVRYLMADQTTKNSAEFRTWYQLVNKTVRENKTKLLTPVVAQKRCLTARVCLTVLWHNQKSSPGNIFSYNLDFSDLSDLLSKFELKDSDYNAGSIVINLELDHKNILLTGDITAVEELALMRGGLLTKVDGLKIAHHGSKYSSDTDFLEFCKPEFSLISVGAGNRFGHPDKRVLADLEKQKTEILRTDQLGKVTLGVIEGRLMRLK